MMTMDDLKESARARFLTTCKEAQELRESGDNSRPSLFRFSLLTILLMTLLAGVLMQWDFWAYENYRGTSQLSTSMTIITCGQICILIPAGLICEMLLRKRRERL
jgi:hypothetical protein